VITKRLVSICFRSKPL